MEKCGIHQVRVISSDRVDRSQSFLVVNWFLGAGLLWLIVFLQLNSVGNQGKMHRGINLGEKKWQINH